MFKRVKAFDIERIGKVFTLELPEGSTPFAVYPNTTHKPRLYYSEPVLKGGDPVELVPFEFICVHNDDPYDDVLGTKHDPKILHYLGTSIGDNGYRIYHVFQLVSMHDIYAINQSGSDPIHVDHVEPNEQEPLTTQPEE